MDSIVEIIHTFSNEDKKEFKTFLQRLRRKSSRKDLELFNLFSNNKEILRKELLQKLYPSNHNLEAYHATRKRLLKQLIDFTALKRTREDASSSAHIMSLISISKYLFEKKREEAAWSFLIQAEILAKKSAHHDLLNNVYSLQIEKSEGEFGPDINEIILKKKNNHDLALQDENANIANQLIRYELNKFISGNEEINVDKIIKKILKEYDLTNAILERPRLLFSIINITRNSILSKKDFYSFEPYVIKNYKQIDKKNRFDRYNHYYKVNMLYMIAHVLYRNKKFREAENYLDLLYENLLAWNKSHFFLLYPKYILLKAAVYNYSGKNQEAVVLLENLLIDTNIRLDKPQLLNTYLNLSIYYFQREEYKKSIKIFQNVQHSDRWLAKIMGREWLMKKAIVECITHYELRNGDLVENRLRAIERNFDDYFKRSIYKRVKTFISLVKQLNTNNSIASTKEFSATVENSFEFINPEMEDIQAMTFYGWIKSKIEKRKYYEVLIELVGGKI